MRRRGWDSFQVRFSPVAGRILLASAGGAIDLIAVAFSALLTLPMVSHDLTGYKLRPLVQMLHPPATEGFEEMNHRLHPRKRALSELILGRE